MSSLACTAYRAILRLHPYEFRAEFGDEMLWVFHEELRSSEPRIRGVARLLLDGARSVVVQHTLRPRERQKAAVVEGCYIDITYAPPMIRFAQAGFLAVSFVSLLFSLSLFLSMVAPRVAALDASKWLYTPVKFHSAAHPPALQWPSH